MKILRYITALSVCVIVLNTNIYAQNAVKQIQFDFMGENIHFEADSTVVIDIDVKIDEATIGRFYDRLNSGTYQVIIDSLQAYKERFNVDDWLYYQLIRRTAQAISPKADNYYRYTLYKWFLLNKSGYDATLSIAGDILLFYVQCDEEIFNIPYHTKDNRQFVCLNYHDYGTIDFEKNNFKEVPIAFNNAQKSFSYKVTSIPEFDAAGYKEKDLHFNYYQTNYSFKVKVNPQVQKMFINYPAVDYSYYFNTPLSHETYISLIPALKKNLDGMSGKEGVDFLMRFTRYAFLFEPDVKVFGQEKRLTPEETLLYNQSDCEDRAALFFYLVKEIYDRPMIVLVFPKHVTVAVNFDKPAGKTISYNGRQYTVCEPTPQRRDLKIGQMLPELRKESYEVVYAYNPQH